MDLPEVTYPSKVGPLNHRTFTFYLGAIVTYEHGEERQFGLDPDMEGADYGGQLLFV
jgi:hypothetical protein